MTDYKARSAVPWILASAIIVIALYYLAVPEWLFAIGGVTAFVIGAVGLVKLGFFVSHNSIILLAAKRDALAITPDSKLAELRAKLAEKLKPLSDTALDIVGRTMDFERDVEITGEVFISGTGIPIWFAYEFLSKSNISYLAPRSSFGSFESARYKMADTLTLYFVEKNAAREERTGSVWRGSNNPARWVDGTIYRKICMAWFEEIPAPVHSPIAEMPPDDDYSTLDDTQAGGIYGK